MKLFKWLILSFISISAYASDVQHSSVVSLAYYNNVEVEYHDNLYLFQLLLSKHCVSYKQDEDTCNQYLEKKIPDIRQAYFSALEGDKKDYLDIKLKMAIDTSIILAAVHHSDGKYISAIVEDVISITKEEIENRSNIIKQEELYDNNGRTGIDFKGINQVLLEEYSDEILDYKIDIIEPHYFLAQLPTKAEKIQYQTLLFIKEYLELKSLRTAGKKEFDDLLKTVFRDLMGCAVCTTDIITKVSLNGSTWYDEISISEYLLFGFAKFGQLSQVELYYPDAYLFPKYTETSAIDFIYYLRQYILQKDGDYFVSKEMVENDHKPSDVDNISWEIMRSILQSTDWNIVIRDKVAVPNVRRLWNSLIKILTGPTGATFVDKPSQVLNKAVTTNYKVTYIGKLFNVTSAFKAVVKHVPKVVYGESLKGLCNSDALIGTGFTNSISLEDICVYVPSFRFKTFSITIGSKMDRNSDFVNLGNQNPFSFFMYSIMPIIVNPWETIFSGVDVIDGGNLFQYGQDMVGYRVMLVHRSGTIVYRNIMFEKQELQLSKSRLIDSNIENYTLKIISNFSGVEVAHFQLNDGMFVISVGGVVKGNKFYFVKEIEDHDQPQYLLKWRVPTVCTDLSISEYSCMDDKYYPRVIPDYYLQNIEEIPMPH
ncbi:hypothetical protein [Moritella marina]|uniref:hypothetical protein n=1 Tax=Moritella marina TaxID=90736 RepID=UPI0037039DAC